MGKLQRRRSFSGYLTHTEKAPDEEWQLFSQSGKEGTYWLDDDISHHHYQQGNNDIPLRHFGGEQNILENVPDLHLFNDEQSSALVTLRELLDVESRRARVKGPDKGDWLIDFSELDESTEQSLSRHPTPGNAKVFSLLDMDEAEEDRVASMAAILAFQATTVFGDLTMLDLGQKSFEALVLRLVRDATVDLD